MGQAPGERSGWALSLENSKEGGTNYAHRESVYPLPT